VAYRGSVADAGGPPEERHDEPLRLEDISSTAWEHPADRGALVALRQLRGFDFVLRKLAGLWNERALRLVFLGSAVRVDESQFPRVHREFASAGVTLDAPELPELYVLSDPQPNAMSLGIDQPFVVVTSGLLELLDGEELRFVLGHELGHVLSGHALYTTMVLQMAQLSGGLSWVPLGAVGLRAVLAGLYEWQRKAELSCDRAGLLACQDELAAQWVLMKLASGGRAELLDATAFAAQGDEYLNSDDMRDTVLKLLLLEARTHPFAVARAAELRRWAGEGGYGAILAGEYPRRGDAPTASVRADVTDAARHYRDRFEHSQDPIVSVIRDAGGAIGSAVGWVASRLGGAPTTGDGEPVEDDGTADSAT
jgi:Zn-dependent protease with chaperone function